MTHLFIGTHTRNWINYGYLSPDKMKSFSELNEDVGRPAIYTGPIREERQHTEPLSKQLRKRSFAGSSFLLPSSTRAA